jgi:ribulose-phosphate 3-epimerase
MTASRDRLAALPSGRLMAELSVWSADLLRLASEVARVDAHADVLHVDVADGHFSPALLFFPDLVAALRRHTERPIHVHLMTADAILLDQVAQFADAGADLVSVHAENANAVEALSLIEARGLAAGLVLQLHTPVAAAAAQLPRLRMLTLLGTRIGIKGQGLDETAEPRLREARALIAKAGAPVLLAADGGIREHTVPGLRAAGADTVVMGSLAFNDPDLAARIAWIRALHG